MVLTLLAGVTSTPAATVEIFPGTGVFSSAAERLQPGDTLVVHEGIYNEVSRMSIQVQGTAGNPIVIVGAAGEAKPIVTRPDSASLQNTINIEGSARYLTIRGLEIIGNGGDGVNISGTVSFITLEDLDIHDVDVGVNFRNSMDHVTVRRTHIYRTGRGGGTGEGMYIGCNDATCIVHDSVLERNWIHDTLPGTTQGDGIEVKVGSHSNVIRDNVIYNRPYPCIFVYGTGANPVNIVEGNVVWNCLEGIYAVADAVVRNNIVTRSGTGLSLYGHAQVSQMKDVTAVNNTLYDNDTGVYVRWGGTGMTLANNAIYSPGKRAVDSGSGIASTATVRSNYLEGGSDVPIDGLGFVAGGNAAGAFVDPADMDFWPKPGSPLVGTASADLAPAVDFNSAPRATPYDVGAYETNGQPTNPGWRIVEGLKGVGTPVTAPAAPTDLRVR